MIQVREVTEKAEVFLVTSGICAQDIVRVGLNHASTPQDALDQAFARIGEDASVAVLRGAAEMLPIVGG